MRKLEPLILKPTSNKEELIKQINNALDKTIKQVKHKIENEIKSNQINDVTDIQIGIDICTNSTLAYTISYSYTTREEENKDE